MESLYKRILAAAREHGHPNRLAESECEHKFRDAAAGPVRARLFRCDKCGAEEERDVS